MRARTLTLSPWKVTVLLLVGGRIARVPAVSVRRYGAPVEVTASDVTALGKTWYFGQLPRLVWVHDREDVAVLAHELLHVVFGILAVRGVDLSEDSEEAYTYLLEDLIRQATSRTGWQRP